MLDYGKSSIAIERAVIGAVVNGFADFDEIPLDANHFSSLQGRALWQAIGGLRSNAITVDTVTLFQELERLGKVDLIPFVADCSSDGASRATAAEMAVSVRAAWLHRETLKSISDAVELGKRGELYGDELVGEISRRIATLDATGVVDPTSTLPRLADEHFSHRDEQARLGVINTGFPTGVASLDKLIGGWQPGLCNIICGRPGHGKSSLALASTDAITKAGYGVHVFSLEDTRDRYIDRAASRMALVSTNALATGYMTIEENARFTSARKEINRRTNWLIDDRSGVSADEVIRSVRRHRKVNDTKVVVVDYLTLLREKEKSYSKHDAVGKCINLFADAAKNDGLCYIVCAQLNREVEKKDNKRPIAADLRESGSIEERAKLIVAMFYEFKHLQFDKEPTASQLEHAESLKSKTELIVLKNSNGEAPASVTVNFDGPTTRIWG